MMQPRDLDVAHHFVHVNGIRMHYVEKGRGPLVVMLHGFPENWWSWRYQIDPLVKAGYRVVVPDLRGYNDTDAIGPYDIDTLADDVRSLIETLHASHATIISHDWGGAVAWRFATRYPAMCDHLVVMNCPHPAIMRKALLSKPSQIARSWYMFFFQLPFLPERAITRDGGAGVMKTLRAHAIDRTNFGDEELRPLAEGVTKPGRATGMLNWYRASMRAGFRPRSEIANFAAVEMPVLIVWGMGDRALGFEELVPGTERYATKLQVKTIANCGHFVQQEQPERVNRAVLEWLGNAPEA